MLRASVEMQAGEVDLKAITDDDHVEDSGIAHAPQLVAFAEAVAGDDDALLDETRAALREACGSEVLVDAAAVAANFQRMVRIADGTGIPLDTPIVAMSEGFRDELGLNDFHSAANTREITGVRRVAGKLVTAVARAGMRGFGRLRGGRARRR